MKIAITGSLGFVGQNFLIQLQNFEAKPITRQQLNNLTLNDIVGCNAVVHLAGKAHDLKKTSNPDDYYNVNYDLTKKLYNCFLESDAEKFIFISSVKAASDEVNGALTEEMIPNPQTHYGKSKLMAEQYIQAQQLPEGKSYYILRPCMIHGPGNKGNLNLLYKFVQKGIPYPLAAFNNRRSFLSVQNLCFVIEKLLTGNVASGIYNVADDEALSTNTVVSILSASINRKPKLWAIPSNLVRFLAKVGDKIKLPLNTERLNKLTENYVVSNNKIKVALNTQLPLSTTVGLAKTAESFKQYNSDC